ncbi:PTS fructose transporter subunit IIC, partial [Vibrio sp. 10N.261.48.A2]
MSTLTTQATNTSSNSNNKNSSSDFKKILSTMKGHLLFGTSHMLPFIVAGGVLLALAVMASGKGAVPA